MDLPSRPLLTKKNKYQESAQEIMTLIGNIERRRKSTLFYKGDNFGALAINYVNTQEEYLEQKLFDEDFLLDNHHSLISYFIAVNDKFNQLQDKLGVNDTFLLDYVLGGLVMMIFSLWMIKYYSIA